MQVCRVVGCRGGRGGPTSTAGPTGSRPPPGQALRASGVEVAVGHQRTPDRQGELTTVGVAGEDDRRPVGDHRVEHALVGRMDQPHGEAHVLGSGTRHGGIPVIPDMRVVRADELDGVVAHRDDRSSVVDVDPSTVPKPVDERLHGEVRTPLPHLGVPSREVSHGVLGDRAEVVVAPQDERAGEVEERFHRAEQRGHRPGVREVVSGVDDEVGLQGRKGPHPVDLPGLPRREVQVGDLEDAHRRGAGWEGRHGIPTEHEPGPLHEGGVRRPDDSGTHETADGAKRGAGGLVHLAILAKALPPHESVWVATPRARHTGRLRWETGAMTDTTLKTQLQRDLHDAMRARDKVRAGTLRMTLTSITTAEVAGDEARELSDDEVLRVIAKEAKKRKESAAAFAGAGRGELAATEEAELAVLKGYLPEELGDDELRAIVERAVASTGATGMPQMGQVMKAAQAEVAGRADGGRVAAVVQQVLSAR